jgi:4-amino-4-deoxy-L-arabinose transferase-like glycosyltransferase
MNPPNPPSTDAPPGAEPTSSETSSPAIARASLFARAANAPHALIEFARGARGELSLFAFGLALVWLNAFNDYHALALSTKLAHVRLDIGYLFVALATLLYLTRGDGAPSQPAPSRTARDPLSLLGFFALAAGVGAELLAHYTGLGTALIAGGVFLPDGLVVAGGALWCARASRPVWPRSRVSTLAYGAMVLGLAATLAYAYATRAPFFEALSAHYAAGAQSQIFGVGAALANPAAIGAAAEHATQGLAEILRAPALAAPRTPIVLGYGGALAILGVLAFAWCTVRARTNKPIAPEPSFWRGGAWVLAAGGFLYLPTLGAFGFYDPWEGHYAEVARQMLWRDDFVSLYWENNWFWSKPVGIFWMMAVAFKGFGVSDLVARLPFALTGMAGMLFVYFFCRKLWSARAGIIAAIALGTFPQYLFTSRQVMTDIPVVVLTIIGIGCLMLALFARDDDEVPRTPLTVTFIALFTATTLPQYSLLAAELERYGVLHALSYAGAFVALILTMRRATRARQIFVYAFYWSVGLGCLAKGLIAPGLPVLVLFAYLICSGEWGDLFTARRAGLGFLVSAIAFGIAVVAIRFGFRVPGNDNLYLGAFIGAAVLGVLAMAATARGGVWDRLEVGRGLLIFALTALPWFVAMSARHGGAQLDPAAPGGFRLTGFLHEFIIQHHFDRLGGGVHGDTGTTFEYFVRWGAYALFPWIAFVPGALSRFWSGRADLAIDPAGAGARSAAWTEARVKLFVFLWFVVFFTLFTMSATKFHHYILPALPPLAIMLGVWLDRAGDDERELTRPILAAAVAILIFVGWDLYRTPQNFFNSFTYVFSGRSYPWPTSVMPEGFFRIAMVTMAGVLVLGLMPRPKWSAPPRTLSYAVGLVFVGLALAVVLNQSAPTSLKLYGVPPEKLGAYREALATVMPTPPAAVWTEYVQHAPVDRFWKYAKIIGRLADFGFGTLAAFAAILAIAAFYGIGRRRVAMFLFGGLAYVFAAYLAHVHMVELGPHSGQRHMWDAYMQRRAGPQEKLCAYMMNWRSEHWYSHNEVVVGLSDPPLVAHARRAGRQWVITERTRVNDVRNLLQQRNQICRAVFEWDNWSNRYSLLSIEDAPGDPQVKACLERKPK